MTTPGSTDWFTLALELGQRRRTALAALKAVLEGIDALLADGSLTTNERKRFTRSRRHWAKMLEQATAA
jgi:hypothetical protein